MLSGQLYREQHAKIQRATLAEKSYTPEEFLDNVHSLYFQTLKQDNMGDFSIKDLIAGLRLRIEMMKKVFNELVAFQKRIDDYYKIDLKARK